MNSFYEHHKDSIRFHYRCFDRILLNGLIQPFQRPERVIGFFDTYRQLYPVSRDTLRGIADRRAYYCCVLALVRHADDPEPLIAEGRWHGEILDAPRGANGFGYDPYFFLPALNATAAELEPTVKNATSHRALALQQLFERLKEEA